MSEPDDAAAIRRDLHRHAFAHAAEAAEQVVGQELEIPGDGAVGLGLAGPRGLAADGGLLDGGFRGLLRLGFDGLLFRNGLPGNLLLGTLHKFLPYSGLTAWRHV